MLSTFLSQLQTYFSKYFFIGSYLPVVAFAFLNALGAYVAFEPVRGWADKNFSTWSDKAWVVATVGVVLLIFAYLLSALATFLRRQLEGAWANRLGRRLFVPAQNRRRERLIKAVHEAAMNMADLQHTPAWERELREAREEGMRNHANVKFAAVEPDPLETSLATLETQRVNNEMLAADTLENLKDNLVSRLKSCDEDASPIVSKQHERFIAITDYGRARSTAYHARSQNELNSNFGSEQLAPTKMGNIANTIQSYALRRYHCNFEIIWSNLQRVVQRDEKSQAALQEAKTQLDFLVACSWLTLLWTAIWMVVTCSVESRNGFVAVALVGPLIAYMWYRAAAEQYRSFADIVTTCIDSFRLDLLRELRLRTPSDVEDERFIWESFDRLTTFGDEYNFRYEPPKQA